MSNWNDYRGDGWPPLWILIMASTEALMERGVPGLLAVLIVFAAGVLLLCLAINLVLLLLKVFAAFAFNDFVTAFTH